MVSALVCVFWWGNVVSGHWQLVQSNFYVLLIWPSISWSSGEWNWNGLKQKLLGSGFWLPEFVFYSDCSRLRKLHFLTLASQNKSTRYLSVTILFILCFLCYGYLDRAYCSDLSHHRNLYFISFSDQGKWQRVCDGWWFWLSTRLNSETPRWDNNQPHPGH